MGRDKTRAQRLPWFSNVRFVSHDIQDSALAFAPKAGSLLVHLAWPGLPNYKSLFHFEQNLPHAYAFVKRMIEAGVNQVLIAGTCLEYGNQGGALPSSQPTRPDTPYGMAKDMLRRQLELLKAELPYTLQWARLFYMYGEGQNPRSILAQLDTAISRGDAIFDMSAGEQLRDYLPVESVARQLQALLATNLGGAFNVCSGKPISIRRLVEEHIAAREANILLNLGHYPYPDHEPMAFWGVPDAH